MQLGQMPVRLGIIDPADYVVAKTGLGIQHRLRGQASARDHIEQLGDHRGGPDVDRHAENGAGACHSRVLVVDGRMDLGTRRDAMIEDPVLVKARLRRDHYRQLALDVVLTSENLSPGGIKLHGALATGAFAAAGCGQNDTRLPSGLKNGSAFVNRDFLVIGLEDYAEMLHLRFAHPAPGPRFDARAASQGAALRSDGLS